MVYLTVGKKEITRDSFSPVKNGKNNILIPKGGLWLTKQDLKCDNYNEWVDFLINNPNVFFYTNKAENLWEQPCLIVTIKDDTKIFNLTNDLDYNYLMRNYRLDDKRFSYELLSQDYDGLYVDIRNLISSDKFDNQLELIKQFAVSSLVLFNLDCIDYYNSGYVLIDPFDLEYYMYKSGSYKIAYDKVKKRIR